MDATSLGHAGRDGALLDLNHRSDTTPVEMPAADRKWRRLNEVAVDYASEPVVRILLAIVLDARKRPGSLRLVLLGTNDEETPELIRQSADALEDLGSELRERCGSLCFPREALARRR